MLNVIDSNGFQKTKQGDFSWITKAEDVSYLAEANGFVVGYLTTNVSSETTCFVRTGPDSPADGNPDRVRATVRDSGDAQGFCCPVKKGDYWTVVSGANQTLVVFWVPLL